MSGQRWWLFFAALLASSLAYGQTSPYQSAESDIRQGNFVAAITVLQSLLDQTPNDLKARNLLGIALVASGRAEDANQAFRRALAYNPAFLPAVKNLAANEVKMGRLEDAQAHFEQARGLAPGDHAVHQGLAQIAFAEGHFKAAWDEYQQSAGLYLEDPRTLLNYVETALAVEQEARAMDALSRLPAESGPEFHFNAGLLLAKLQRYEDASRAFQRARTNAANVYEVDFNLTLAQYKSKNLKAAVDTAKQMIASGERSPEVYSLLAESREGLGETSEAYETLRAATQLYPVDESAYVQLIALCAEHENYDLGLEIGEVGLRLIPASERLHVQRGIVLAMMSRFEEAERELAATNDIQGAIVRALVKMRSGQAEAAVENLRTLRKAHGDDYLVDWLLAEALVQSGGDSEEEAIGVLRKSVALNGDMPQSRLLLGKLLFGNGETAPAIEQLERALFLDPGSLAAAYQLARALRKSGDTSRARELFARVAKQNPKQNEDGGPDVTRSGLLRIARDSAH